jgi:hypothetical protein
LGRATVLGIVFRREQWRKQAGARCVHDRWLYKRERVARTKTFSGSCCFDQILPLAQNSKLATTNLVFT